MHGSERREQIIRQIQESKAPVSGTKLASLYSVSRQVIVQDIALIRAAGYEIISTNRGYILNQPKTVCRIFKVQHTDEQLEVKFAVISFIDTAFQFFFRKICQELFHYEICDLLICLSFQIRH